MLISHNLPLKTTFLNTQLITQYHCTMQPRFLPLDAMQRAVLYFWWTSYLLRSDQISSLYNIHHLTFCSLSSWFTSSCAYDLITVTTFALITYHSLGFSLKTQNHMFLKSVPP